MAAVSVYRPKDGKEDLGLHACTIRNSSSYIYIYSFHARVHGDLSVGNTLSTENSTRFGRTMLGYKPRLRESIVLFVTEPVRTVQSQSQSTAVV